MRRALTLIEVLIAMGVMLVLITAAGSGLQNANKRQSLDQVTENVRQAFLQAKSYAQAGKKDCLACGGTAACEVGDAALTGWRVTVNTDNYVIDGICGATTFSSRQYNVPGFRLVPSGSVTFLPIGLGTNLGAPMDVAVYRFPDTAEVESFRVEISGELSGVTITMSTPTPAPTATRTPTPGPTSTPTRTPTPTPTPVAALPAVGWWKMDNGSGTTASDSSGNGYSVSLVGTVTWTTGKYNGGVNLANSSSSTGWLSRADTAALNFGTGSFTLEGWINKSSRSNGATAHTLVSKYNCCNGAGYNLVVQGSDFGSHIELLLNDGTASHQVQVVGAGSLANGTWYHVAAVVNRTTQTAAIYLNGVLDGSASTSILGSVSNTPVRFGIGVQSADAGNYAPTHGSIDDVRVYNSALTAAQIAADMGGGSPTVTPTPTPVVATVSVAVSASSDDAEQFESSGSMSNSSSDLEFNEDAGTAQIVGMRFNNLTVPQGSTITEAYLQFTSKETWTYTPLVMDIYGQAGDNAPTFTTTNGDITGRAQTAAHVSWSVPGWPTAGVRGNDQKSPNISTVVQEIVGRPGWVSGNSVVIIVNGPDSTTVTGDKRRTPYSYDGGSAQAAALSVSYTTAAATPTATPTPIPTCNVTTVTAPVTLTIGGACTSWVVSAIPSSGTVSGVTFATGSTAIAGVALNGTFVGGSNYSTAVCPGGGPAGSTTLTASCLILTVSRGIGTTTATLVAGPTSTPTRTPTPVPPTPTPTSAVPVPNVAWWKMDENSGVSAGDSSGNGNALGFENNLTWSVGQVGSALAFDGVDDKASITDPANGSLDLGASDFSLVAWVKLDPTYTDSFPTIIGKGGGAPTSAGYWLFWYSSSNYLRFTISNGGGATRPMVNSTAGAIKDNLWHHVAAIAVRGGTSQLYIDGVLNASSNWSAYTGSIDTTASFVVGSEKMGPGMGSDWKGKIDDVRIYNYALTPTQITALYNQ